MGKIVVEGIAYKVIETLPYCQAGMPAKMVETPEGERVAVKRDGASWSWWTNGDRLQRRGRYEGQGGE